jgi:hypothetical protein
VPVTRWPSSLHQAFDVGRDDGLVLDDQDVGGQFGVDVRLGLRDQALHVHSVGVEDLGGFRRREALQGGQQEGLARARGDAHQPARSVVAAFDAALVLKLGAGRGPDGVEHMIERDPRGHLGRQLALAGGEGLQRDTDVVVTGRLIAGQARA